jgi:outer membrane protein assembly factor BamB
MESQMQKLIAGIALASAGALASHAVGAQGREWTTSGGDAQRSSWVRADVRLTKDAIVKGELKFLWKMKLNNEARQLHSLTEPILMDRLISHRGFKALAFVATSSERVFAIDTDLARTYWETVINYSSISPPSYGTAACPGGLIAAVTRPTVVAPPIFGAGGRGGRGGRSGGSVGEPGRGAPNLQLLGQAQGRGQGDPAPAAGRGAPPAAPAAPQGRGAPSPGNGGGTTENVYVLGADGYVRALNTHNGSERYQAVMFLPGNARASGLILADGMLYTATSNNCGAVPNGVYAIDLNVEDGKTISWTTGGPNVAGAAGPALGTDGVLYAAVAEAGGMAGSGVTSQPAQQQYASSIVALDPKTLKLKDWFSAPGADFNASPVVLRHKDKDLIVATANDGRMYVLDSASLGGADHKTPLHVTAKYTAPGLTSGVATWEDQGTRWILAPVAGAPQSTVKFTANGIRPTGSVVAFKLVDQDGKISLEPAWASRDLSSPLTPVIFNGVVFAASSGEHRGSGDAKLTAAQRAQRSLPAVLYALDPATGKELWSSGKTITSFARSGISASAGQVYVVTFDNTLYAFGIPMEH